jgi:capsular polysaccharide biosynthesis protein
MAWRDEVTFFSQAEAIVECTGAGLTNFIYSEGPAPILEIIDPNYMNCYLWSLAESVDGAYWYFYADSVPRHNAEFPDAHVPISMLEKTLGAIFE